MSCVLWEGPRATRRQVEGPSAAGRQPHKPANACRSSHQPTAGAAAMQTGRQPHGNDQGPTLLLDVTGWKMTTSVHGRSRLPSACPQELSHIPGHAEGHATWPHRTSHTLVYLGRHAAQLPVPALQARSAEARGKTMPSTHTSEASTSPASLAPRCS